nr:rhodanese-like domain-containing protein [Texcoconibacillus texcoconensis]
MIQRLKPAGGVEHISTDELKQKLKKKDVQLIDVRTPIEFTGDGIKTSKNIPVHKIKKQHNELDKDKEVIVICQSGVRSNKASRKLKKLGFKKVKNVKGGMSAFTS